MKKQRFLCVAPNLYVIPYDKFLTQIILSAKQTKITPKVFGTMRITFIFIIDNFIQKTIY